jgi:shikimate kinase
MVIVLMGYMASGKTRIGKELAISLGYDFIDLDDHIEANENSTVSQIFNTKGEIFFRKIESIYLKEILNKDTNIVLSLGGGTPCYGNNIKTITKVNNVISFYLKASVNTITERLNVEKEKRPLVSHLSSKEQILEFVGKHLFERSFFYKEADYTINTDNNSGKNIVEEIIFKLF